MERQALPFSAAQFLDLFEAYHLAVWPMQWVLYALGVGAVLLLFSFKRTAGVLIAGILALLWAWMAIVYHFAFFTRINPLAWLFGVLFLAQAALLAWHGIVTDGLRFGWTDSLRGVLGGLLIVYALVAYPALSVVFGHLYPHSATFGLPCPTTIFTIGILFFAREPVPVGLFPVPILWSIVGGSAAWLLDVQEDLGLVVAGALAAGLLVAGLTMRAFARRGRLRRARME